MNGALAGQLTALAIEGIQSGLLLGNTGLTAGQAYREMADLLLHGLTARPDWHRASPVSDAPAPPIAP